MASAQSRSGTRGRPPPKRWVFTCTGSSGCNCAHNSSEMRNPVVVPLFGVRSRSRSRFLVSCLFIPPILLRFRVIRIGTKWLDRVEKQGVPELQSFATGLKKDYDAVKAGLTLEWSNGQTEGQVHRLKLLKRQMYGRGSFKLLRKRVLHRAETKRRLRRDKERSSGQKA